MATRTVALGSSVGLHARPASLLVKVAGEQPVEVSVGRPGAEPVDARSILMVLSLDVRHGEELVVTAEGEGADAAVDAVAELLLVDHDAEAAPAATPAPVTPPPTGSAFALAGVGVSPGVAAGPVARMASAPVLPPWDGRQVDDVAAEAERVTAAMRAVAQQLEQRAAQASTQAAVEVLQAQALMVADPALRDAVGAAVRSGMPGPYAVTEAMGRHRAALLAGGAYLAARVADLDDLRERTVAHLLGLPVPGLPQPGHPFVLVADDLAPADTATLDPTVVLALVTVAGGPTSHTAIIARALGLPAVVGCAGAVDLVDGQPVLVDGDAGLVEVAPESSRVQARVAQARERDAELAGSTGPGLTADGHHVPLLVNIGSAKDLEGLDFVEGVGLFRTELGFLDRAEVPTVAEQVAAYEAVFAALPGRRVVVRTLDAGADKPLPFMAMGHEDNPALGVRGLRTRRVRPEVLTDQLTALATAASRHTADVWVMAPMVSTPAEAREFAALAAEAGLARVGAMVEVPAAALRSAAVGREVTFLSVGTNDLGQYALAADRTVGALADLLDPWQPALLDLVAAAVRGGGQARVPVGVCGEAAADPLLACVLVGLGVSSLSMSRRAVAAVRVELVRHPLAQLQRVARLVLTADDPHAARETALRELG